MELLKTIECSGFAEADRKAKTMLANFHRSAVIGEVVKRCYFLRPGKIVAIATSGREQSPVYFCPNSRSAPRGPYSLSHLGRAVSMHDAIRVDADGERVEVIGEYPPDAETLETANLTGWRIMAGGNHVDTVFYQSDMSADDVLRSEGGNCHFQITVELD